MVSNQCFGWIFTRFTLSEVVCMCQNRDPPHDCWVPFEPTPKRAPDNEYAGTYGQLLKNVIGCVIYLPLLVLKIVCHYWK